MDAFLHLDADGTDPGPGDAADAGAGNRTSAERDGGLLVIGSQGGLIEARLAGQRDLVWDVPAGCKLVADNAQNAARRTHLYRMILDEIDCLKNVLCVFAHR